MTNKQHALVGNILATLSFLMTAYTTLSLNLNSADTVVSSAFTVGTFIGLSFNFILHVLTWIAYVRIGKTGDKGWKIFLLVIAIIWILGAVFGILGGFIMGVGGIELLGALSQLVGSIFFIIAFALKPQNITISNG